MTPDIEALCTRLTDRRSNTVTDTADLCDEAAAALRAQAVLIKALDQRCQEWSDDNEKIEDERDALQARVAEQAGELEEAITDCQNRNMTITSLAKIQRELTSERDALQARVRELEHYERDAGRIEVLEDLCGELRAENEALKSEGIARLERDDRAFVTEEMLAMFNNDSAFCGFHSGLWSYKCPVCREWNRRQKDAAREKP